MPSNRKAFKTCVICGGEFIAGHSAKYCEYCRAHPNTTDELKEKRGRPLTGPKKEKRTPSGKSIKEILAELEAYNREHGTHYTYGKYQLLVGNKNND